jgi:hypothetical protein
METEFCGQVRKGEAQEGLIERTVILLSQDPDREVEGKYVRAAFPLKSKLIDVWLNTTELERSQPANPWGLW